MGDDGGAVFVDDREVEAYRAQLVAWEAEAIANSPSPTFGAVSWESLRTHPEVHWQRLHYNCDPVQGRACYWIDVARLRTPKQVIWWSAHLMGKQWLPWTDWDDLLTEVEGQLPD